MRDYRSAEEKMTKEELTPRERVRLALNHQEPDRVPINITYTSVPYLDVRRQLRLPEELVRPDVWDRVVPACDVVADMSCDFLQVGIKSPSHLAKFDPALDSFTDEFGVTFTKVIRPDGRAQFEMREYPIKEPSFDALERYPWPNPYDPSRYEGVGEQARHLYETTDYALSARLGPYIWEMGNFLCGQAQWLGYVATDPDFCVALLQKAAAIAKATYMEGLNCMGKYVSLIRLAGEDFGVQRGLLISKAMFRRLVKPALADVYLAIKQRLADLGNYDCKLMLHSCGSIEPIIDDLIEIGVDVLDPVQTRARDMNALLLKEKYGARISFHGGIDTQGVLPFGTEEEVVEETWRKIESLAPGGGWILCPTHNVQADVAGRKLIRMVETALVHARYPIQRSHSRESLLAPYR